MRFSSVDFSFRSYEHLKILFTFINHFCEWNLYILIQISEHLHCLTEAILNKKTSFGDVFG